ncbi:hypothetical protein NKR23_g9383 [Pleurostoma richardsiae]|uniref:SnoaL-like domain-containing protein n=1 Tax=Pleurostoma richardsiae TaxID=41990 RepID=A0AA38RFJ8_9PEZI|nr:hypothetical protein NKR23_g9383 [Pleurostoma richardsiae]
MTVSPKTFQSDDSVLDPAIKAHIASLYAAVDNKELEAWGAHFTEDAVFKKGTSNVKGRDTLVNLVTKSWASLKSRDHTVYAVFPFGPKAEEVMLHGRSNNVSLEGEASTFTWAARMHFKRSAAGSVLIDKYTIIVDPHPSTL